MAQVSQPFTPPAAHVAPPVAHSTTLPNLVYLLPAILVAMWFCGFVAVLFIWYARWRRISAALREAAPLRAGREVEALRRVERRGGIRKPIQLLLSAASLEPGICGIVKPVLVWPKGISEHLQDAHLEAILAHEVWHVRRRDNLAAAIHMVVEAIFWFHPLVWWVGVRLLVERERACDEEVLELGSERQVYAESILKTCEFCVESPLACVSGVTGADLKKRIIRVMTEGMANKLSFGRKLVLAGVGIAAVAGPVVFGLVNAPPVRAQSAQTADAPLPSFEVASVRRSRSGENTSFHVLPNRLTVRNYLIAYLIEFAYGHDLGEFGINGLRHNQVVGGPSWIYPGEFDYEGYDIDTKVDDSVAEKFGRDCGAAFFHGSCGYRHQMMLMVQSLLADRFKLKVRHETKESRVYALVIAKGGPKFLHTTFPMPDDAAMQRNPALRPPCPAGMFCYQDYLSMGRVADWLSESRGVDRPVIDQTGLDGGYYIKIQWAREQPQSGNAGMDNTAPFGPSGPSIFTALQQQLGLKLEPTKGPVESIVIEHIERPSEN
jgi:uncharacterized protein (TIGR03435 family)